MQIAREQGLMLHDWGVIAAAFGYIGFLFFVASYGDRLSLLQRGRASALIYPLSLAIYCTSWTFFGSVGFATRTSTDFLAIYLGPILMIGVCTPRAAPRDPAGEIAEHHLDRRFYRRALRQEPGRRSDGCVHRYRRVRSLHRAPAQGRGVFAGNDPERGQGLSSIPIIGDIALVVTLAMAVSPYCSEHARPTRPNTSTV